jgi:hypothetical protein
MVFNLDLWDVYVLLVGFNGIEWTFYENLLEFDGI